MLPRAVLAIALTLSLAGCGDDAETVDCSMSTLSYANFGEEFMTNYCIDCHTTGDPDRGGAPVGVNFETLQLVQNQASSVDRRSGANGNGMPPIAYEAQPSQADRVLLTEWITCGPN